ncbi:hypothetical protein ACH4UT_32420 [Streptomyces sp. NPDC020799]|uniref:hypothetical protein n=1 Tax=Streptomyces sp. NPDC020799 TaxID=3365091 RepID=UPI00378E3931
MAGVGEWASARPSGKPVFRIFVQGLRVHPLEYIDVFYRSDSVGQRYWFWWAGRTPNTSDLIPMIVLREEGGAGFTMLYSASDAAVDNLPAVTGESAVRSVAAWLSGFEGRMVGALSWRSPDPFDPGQSLAVLPGPLAGVGEWASARPSGKPVFRIFVQGLRVHPLEYIDVFYRSDSVGQRYWFWWAGRTPNTSDLIPMIVLREEGGAGAAMLYSASNAAVDNLPAVTGESAVRSVAAWVSDFERRRVGWLSWRSPDPFDPRQPLTVMDGPLEGTGEWASARPSGKPVFRIFVQGLRVHPLEYIDVFYRSDSVAQRYWLWWSGRSPNTSDFIPMVVLESEGAGVSTELCSVNDTAVTELPAVTGESAVRSVAAWVSDFERRRVGWLSWRSSGDPFDPRQPLTVMDGPLEGTGEWASGDYKPRGKALFRIFVGGEAGVRSWNYIDVFYRSDSTGQRYWFRWAGRTPNVGDRIPLIVLASPGAGGSAVLYSSGVLPQ